MAGMTALQATLAKFEAEAAQMAAIKKDIAASRGAGKPPPAKRAKKGSGAGTLPHVLALLHAMPAHCGSHSKSEPRIKAEHSRCGDASGFPLVARDTSC